MADTPRICCIVGVPRTGSTHLARKLARFERLHVREEIFHPSDTQNIGRGPESSRIAPLALVDFVESREDLAGWVREHPTRVLDWLLDNAEGQTLVFKLFPDHLSMAHVHSLVGRPDFSAIVIWRKPIDSYISHLKAEHLRNWRSVDTTGIVVRADMTTFCRLCVQWREWYASVLGALSAHSTPFIELGYESDLCAHDADARIARALTQLRIKAGGVQPVRAELFKQDRENSYERKVSNWAEFQRMLERAGLTRIAFSERGLA